jgi:hypothetical protein
MYRAKLVITLLAAAILCLMCIGCSGTTAEQSPIMPPRQPELNRGHSLLGLYGLIIDSSAGTVDIIPARLSWAHYDVAPMLMDPKFCPSLNCIFIEILYIDPVTNIHSILATLRNPMDLTGYDVRGTIFQSATHQHGLINFDAYTSVFGSPGFPFNPFIAFAKDVGLRKFPPQAVHSATFELEIPPQPNQYEIYFAVDASWPDNCLEPYDITSQEQIGEITDKHGSECTVRCKVQDWQDPTDMHSVVLDGEMISGTAILMSYNATHEAWECTIANNMNAEPGEYLLPVTAMANDSPDQTRDFITLTVTEAPKNHVHGIVEAYMGGGPMPGIFCFTTDGDNIYSDTSDDKGEYDLYDVPNGGRVISFTGVGTLAQFHEVCLTGDGAVVNAEMPCVFLYVPGPPDLEVNPPDVDPVGMKAIISGIVDQFHDNNAVVLVVDGEEELHQSEEGKFAIEVPLHSGLNKIRVRACNAKGITWSDWIEIDI